MGLDLDKLIHQLTNGKEQKVSKSIKIKEQDIKDLCLKAKAILLSQPSLLELESPINVVGDIHGQFNNLLDIFKSGGFPPEANYLFLGDYVDRGRQSLETICLLLAYKIKYPQNFFLLRGNHESQAICSIYGFYEECRRRMNNKIFKCFTEVFDCLPIAAVIEDKIFCCHGGLSPDLFTLDQISKMKRPINKPEENGLVADLLWSDPSDEIDDWAPNERGISVLFGRKILEAFLERYNFDLFLRSHQVVEDGYEFFADRKLCTIFSAKNYCGEFDNAGAFLSIDENLMCSFKII